MRELEFLPDWYPRLRRRKRFVLLQAWMTVVLVIGLGFCTVLLCRNVRGSEVSLNGLHRQLNQTDAELQKLNDLLTLQKQWQQQAQVLSQLGPHVPAARLFDSLAELMPPQMALLELSTSYEEQEKQLPSLVAAKGDESSVDRHLRVRLHGVAPTDVDLGNFLAKLTSVPYFGNIAMSYARDRTDGGHLMREFEVTFTVSLNEGGK
jgi:Tfp pilus assembly protein PilN